uniref:C2H2-type domain-containing protein n=1 Tax=Gouania willdenowi TaxID=441366 RepID=A0A8C5E6M8_GOUWI
MLSAAYITDHMRVHNQSQHYACTVCNRSFTTLTYLRVHAQKHHGQEWKDGAGLGASSVGGVLLCQLCGIQCKTAMQLQGHMGTHANQEAADDQGSGAEPSGAGPSSTVGGAAESSPSTAALLVTDCSSLNQSHS